MDPLSFSASLIAVLELTVTLMRYVNDVRNAPRERAQIAREASNVYALLTTLRFRVEDAPKKDPWFDQIRLLAAEDGPLDQFKTILERLVHKVESSSKLKDLLWKFNKAEIEEALAQIERLKSLISLALANDLFTLAQAVKTDISEVAQDLDALRLERESEWPSRLSAWLDIPDPSSNYTAACKRRQEGTGSWLLQDESFITWKTSPGSTLWLHGIPGCGKTVLSATIIDQVQSIPHSSVAYFYFDFNDDDKRKVNRCIRSLVMQLATQVADGVHEIRELHAKCHDGQIQPQDSALIKVMSRLIQKLGHSYVIFDALDECDDYQELLDLIESFTQRHQNCLHFLATSRRERELEERLQPIITAEIHIQAASVDADINLYVQDLLKNDVRLRKWPTDVRNEIQETIAEKSNGMFRWAFCQIDSLRKCIKLSALRQMLSTLPKTLDETYERILSTIEGAGQLDDALRILQWLCFARRPQSLKSLVDVLATDVGGNGSFLVEERLPEPLDIITICSSLITVREETQSERIRVTLDPEDPIIQLAHFSVQEYLLSDRCFLNEQFSAPRVHALLAETSLIYTLHICQESHPPGSQNLDVPPEPGVCNSLGRTVRRKDKTLSLTYEQYPLCRYACAWWYKHAAELPETDLSQRAIEMSVRLFENTDNILEQWLKLHSPNPFSWSKGRSRSAYFTGFRKSKRSVDIESKPSRVASPVFYATATGLRRIVEILIEGGNDVNQINHIYPTPLHVAVLKGDLTTAKLILNNGGNVNQRHEKAGSPLQIASASGNNLEMVKLLLEAGATLYQPASDFTFLSPYTGFLTEMNGTVLQAACYGGSLEVLQTLLEAGEKLHDSITPSSVLRAVEEGFEHASDKQPIPDISTPDGRTVGPHVPVWPSFETRLHGGRPGFSRDHTEIVRLLLSHGIDAGTALWNAYDPADLAFFYVLLDAGVSPNTADEWGDTLLHRALYDNQPGLFNRLLKYGADITALNFYGRTCIDYARPFPHLLQDFYLSPEQYSTTNADGWTNRLCETMLRNIERLLKNTPTFDGAYPVLRQLGHCLVYSEWLKEAISVFQMTIISASELETGFKQRVLCDGCDADSPQTILRVCRTCPDTDLCGPCFQLYQAGALRDIHLCQGHQFLEVLLSPFDEEFTQFGVRLTPKMTSWLLELKGKILRELSEDSDPCSSVKAANAPINAEEHVDSKESTCTPAVIEEEVHEDRPPNLLQL